jgi:hypothetical protein
VINHRDWRSCTADILLAIEHTLILSLNNVLGLKYVCYCFFVGSGSTTTVVYGYEQVTVLMLCNDS